MKPTLSHRLILPVDTNHHGTLYAGSLLRMALEAGYATACREVGGQANLVLRRVLNLECLRPVAVGSVIEIQGLVLYRSQAYLVTGLVGSPLQAGQDHWMEALMGFVQIDEKGHPTPFPPDLACLATPPDLVWKKLAEKLQRLLKIR